tara:strand:- start:1927 stop:2133 length:207 start_codon:yes stop_codon:yes gene_type:complete
MTNNNNQGFTLQEKRDIRESIHHATWSAKNDMGIPYDPDRPANPIWTVLMGLIFITFIYKMLFTEYWF